MAYGFGVPERLWKYNPAYKNQSYLIHTKEEKAEERFLMKYKPDYKHDLNWLYGGKDVADLIFVTHKLLTAYDTDSEKEFDVTKDLDNPLSKETPHSTSNSDSEGEKIEPN
jgi:hypothetical protein